MTLAPAYGEAAQHALSGQYLTDRDRSVERRDATTAGYLLSDRAPVVVDLTSPATSRGLRVRIGHDGPSWLAESVTRLGELLLLPPDWDSYGAPRVQIEAVETLLTALSHALVSDVPAPSVVPKSDGGIQFEWHVLDMDVEVESLSTGHVSTWYRDRRTSAEQEHEEPVGQPQALAEALATLAERTRTTLVQR
jgi:hypothetical protein